MKLERMREICERVPGGVLWADANDSRSGDFLRTFSPERVRLLLDVAEAARAVRLLDWTTDEKTFERLHCALKALEALGSEEEGG